MPVARRTLLSIHPISMLWPGSETCPFSALPTHTYTALSVLPHSKQHAFDRDVINPQDGHILCDPNPAIYGLSLRIL